MIRLLITLILPTIFLYANTLKENTEGFKTAIKSKNINKAVYFLHEGIESSALYVGEDFNKTQLCLTAESLVKRRIFDTGHLKVALLAYIPFEKLKDNYFSSNELYYAIISGDNKRALTLMSNLSKEDKKSNELLLLAVQSNNIDMVKELLKMGSDINHISYSGTSLFMATMYGYRDLVMYLLENDADIGISTNVIANYYPIKIALENGDEELVNIFLEYEPKTNKDIYYDSILESAIKFSTLKTIKKILPRVKNINAKNKNIAPFIETAFYAGKTEIYNYLILKGAKPTFIKEQNISTLLQAVALDDKKKFNNLLKNKIDIDSSTKTGKTALVLSIELDRLEMSKKLINSGADLNRNGAIFSAINNGNKELIQLFITKGVDLSVSDNSNKGVLSAAVINKDLNLVKLFVENKVNVNGNKGDNRRKKPLYFALTYADIEMIKFLIHSGIVLDEETLQDSAQMSDIEVFKLLFSHFKSNNKEVNLVKLASAALSYNRLDILKVLIEQGLDPSFSDEYGKTILMKFAEFNYAQGAEYFLNLKVDVNAVDEKGRSALHYACMSYMQGQALQTVKLLIDRGAYIDLPDNKINTPLMYAAREGKEKLVKYLLSQKASTKLFINADGESALDLAKKSANIKTIRLIKGVSELDISIDSLFIAAEGGNLKELKRQLKAGVNINSINKYGYTALMSALYKTEDITAEYLIDAGAELNILGNNNLTALYILVQRNHNKNIHLIEKMLKNGADVNLHKIEKRWDFTPLMRASDDPILVDLLLKYGADKQQKDIQGLDAFYYSISSKKLNLKLFYPAILKSELLYKYFIKAAETDNVEVVNFLLTKGVDINTLSPNKNSALHRAVLYNSKKTVAFLINKGINVNSLNRSKDNALHLAVMFKYKECVQLLVDAGADMMIKNSDGKSAIDIAIEKKNKEILEILNAKK